MRRALCVGIDYYMYYNSLANCVSDALSMEAALKFNGDDSINFEVDCMLGVRNDIPLTTVFDPSTGGTKNIFPPRPQAIRREDLMDALEGLFDTEKELDVALFYFAGHGYTDANGGYLCTSDVLKPRDGVSLDYLMTLVRNSKVKNKIIILDSCYSGDITNLDSLGNYSYLPKNTVIMSSCTNSGTARDGCYTPLMIAALEGGAMNLLGEVSPSSVHAFIDRALGAKDQRPVLKANIENSVCLRKNLPLIKPQMLREITDIFLDSDMVLPLDPDYEEDKRPVDEDYLEYAPHDREKERIMKILRTYCSLNLVVPEGADYMYWAALRSQGCRLTPLGKYFWHLAKDGRI